MKTCSQCKSDLPLNGYIEAFLYYRVFQDGDAGEKFLSYGGVNFKFCRLSCMNEHSQEHQETWGLMETGVEVSHD